MIQPPPPPPCRGVARQSIYTPNDSIREEEQMDCAEEGEEVEQNEKEEEEKDGK